MSAGDPMSHGRSGAAPHGENTAGLALLMELDGRAGAAHGPAELSAILAHQLSARLRVDLPPGDSAGSSHAEEWIDRTFGELLSCPQPPVEALRCVKEFAKAAGTEADGPLPAEISAVLYYASIAAARVRCHRRISSLDDDTLCRGVERMLGEPWCAEPLRALWEEALTALRK